jgi:GNAT superfamily N-acetyltransferase
MDIRVAASDEEIAACFPVMRELRPGIAEQEFVSRVRELAATGYLLAYATDADQVVAVAGYRIGDNLAWGRFLYVDDLVTLASRRSKGHGAALLDWLRRFAVDNRCSQLHLDSGIQRKDAHRFYEREGMELFGYHFREVL